MDPIEELMAERHIRRLLALYAQHADDADSDAYEQLFAEDGAIVVGSDRVQGRAAVGQWLLGTLTGKPLRHIMVNADIEVVSSTAATGTMDMALLRKDDSGWRVWATPRYRDRFIKTADGWKFAERHLEAR